MDYKNFLTYSDISEIPKLLLNFKLPNDSKLLSKFKEVFLLGRGSSGNATLFAKYIWEMYCGVISNIVHPFSIFNCKKKLDFKRKILISFSQSGQSPDIVKCSKIIKSMGVFLVGVTNESDLRKNKLAKISNIHILLSNSKEIPVAATKSFHLQMWFVLRIANIFGAGFRERKFNETIKNLNYIIENFEKIYKDYSFEDAINSTVVGFVGRGPYNAISEDAALKFREMAMMHSLGYSAAEFLHGPVGAYKKGDFIFILSPSKKLTPDLVLVENKLKEKNVDYKIITPFSNNYPFNSLEIDILLKLVALKFAVIRGLNPDNPKGLTKVTHTI